MPQIRRKWRLNVVLWIVLILASCEGPRPYDGQQAGATTAAEQLEIIDFNDAAFVIMSVRRGVSSAVDLYDTSLIGWTVRQDVATGNRYLFTKYHGREEIVHLIEVPTQHFRSNIRWEEAHHVSSKW